jgi:hypothetical protein
MQHHGNHKHIRVWWLIGTMLLVLVGMSGCTGPLFGNEPPGWVTVHVLTATGVPVARATLTFTPITTASGANDAAGHVTGPDGTTTSSPLRPGTYTVTAYRGADFASQNVTILPQQTVAVTIFLHS